MKKVSLLLIITAFKCSISNAQTVTNDFYNVRQVVGDGIKFWSDNNYKIHMGNTAEYKYGPVTDYSIKTNMSNTAGRGWTWGVDGAVPVAAIGINGNMKLQGNFTSLGNSYIGSGATELDFGFLTQYLPNFRHVVITGTGTGTPPAGSVAGASGASGGTLIIGTTDAEKTNQSLGAIYFGQKTAATNWLSGMKSYISGLSQGNGGSTNGFGSALCFGTAGDNTGTYENRLQRQCWYWNYFSKQPKQLQISSKRNHWCW
jgi:hypothetical protein